jgi:uncharacterized membrane protein (DUF485 family)
MHITGRLAARMLVRARAPLRPQTFQASTGRGWTMATASYKTIENNPSYQELVRKRSSFGWSLSAAMLVIYFGFILLVGYAPKTLGIPLGSGVMTLGIPIGLLVIISAFVLTGLYVARANSQYDTLVRKIVEDAK